MLLLSAFERGELNLVRFEGVSEARKAGWLADWRCEAGCVRQRVFVCVSMCSRRREQKRVESGGVMTLGRGDLPEFPVFSRLEYRRAADSTSCYRVTLYWHAFVHVHLHPSQCTDPSLASTKEKDRGNSCKRPCIAATCPLAETASLHTVLCTIRHTQTPTRTQTPCRSLPPHPPAPTISD